MKVMMIGCGRWGSLIAWYLSTLSHEVTLYGRESSANMQRFLRERKNDLLTLPPSVTLTTELAAARDAEVILISVPAQSLRALLREPTLRALRDKTFVLCMKGIEVETGMRLSQVTAAEADRSNHIAVWLGPGHVQDFYAGIPNCMVIDSDEDAVKCRLIDAFSGKLIRFYYGDDMIRQRDRRGGEKCHRHCRRRAGRVGAVHAQGRAHVPRNARGSKAHRRYGRQRTLGIRALPPRRL